MYAIRVFAHSGDEWSSVELQPGADLADAVALADSLEKEGKETCIMYQRTDNSEWCAHLLQREGLLCKN